MSQANHNYTDAEQQSGKGGGLNSHQRSSGLELLFQVMLDFGLDHSLPIRMERIEGKAVYFVQGIELVACFEKGLSAALITHIVGCSPFRAAFCSDGFENYASQMTMEGQFFYLSHYTEVLVIERGS